MRRVLLALFLLLATAAAADTVHFVDGTSADGRLTFCDEEECVLARKRLEHRTIAHIVFDPAVELPYGVRGIVLRDGRFRGGTFTGLTLGYVEFNGEEVDRDEVAAILLVPIPRPPEDEQPPPVMAPTPPPAAHEGTPPPDAPPPPPSPSSGGATPAPPSPSAAVPTCDPRHGMSPASGVMWSGRGRSRSTMGSASWRHERNAEYEVQLREHCQWPVFDRSVSPPRKIGTVLQLYGSVVEHETFLDHQGGPSPCLCDGEKTHTSSFDHALIFQRTAAGDATRALGFDLPAHRRPIYVMTLGGQGTVEAPCRGESCGGSAGGTMLQLSAGRVPIAAESWDPEERTLEGGILRGTYTRPVGPSTLQVAWSICRAGVQCPPPPEFAAPPATDEEPGETPPDDPCARAGQQQAFADTCRSQLDAAVNALEPLFAEYNGIMTKVTADSEAFEAMQKYCLAYDVVQQILESILTAGTGPAAEAAQALLHLRDLIAKIESGDLVAEFYPSEVKKVLDLYKKTQAVWFELTADDVTRMQRDVDGCSGKAPLETYMAAKRFVENLAASRRFWDSRLAPAINNVRGKGQECASLNHEAWRACFQDAQCREETPDCGPEPSLEGAYDQ